MGQIYPLGYSLLMSRLKSSLGQVGCTYISFVFCIYTSKCIVTGLLTKRRFIIQNPVFTNSHCQNKISCPSLREKGNKDWRSDSVVKCFAFQALSSIPREEGERGKRNGRKQPNVWICGFKMNFKPGCQLASIWISPCWTVFGGQRDTLSKNLGLKKQKWYP